jgi:hypothetical protein
MKKTIILLLILFPAKIFAQNYDFSYEKEADLNSDGKTDFISLEKAANNIDFKLIINDSEINGTIDDEPDGILIVDILSSDSYKEIAVHSPGPSDDDVFMLYWYDGKSIHYMNTLARWPEFKGNSIVYVTSWEGFWMSKEKYKLNQSTRKLVHYKQAGYYIGQEVDCHTGFRIYRTQALKEEVALLSSKSKIQIVLCDKAGYDYFEQKYLIKSSSGLLGWTDFKTLEKHATLMFAD